MAVVAISALPASTVLAGTDIMPAVVGGITKKITAANLRTQLFGLASADPLSVGVLTAVGNSTITGTLSGITSLTASTGAFTAITQTAVSFGQVTLNTSSGATTDANAVFYQRGGITKWRIGTNILSANNDAFEVYNEGAGVSPITISNSTRILTVSSGLIATAGDVAITAGNLTIATAVSKIIPGATSLALRNNADNANNILVTDAGVVTVRAGMTVTAGGIVVTAGGLVVSANGLTVQGGVATFQGGVAITASPIITSGTAITRIVPGATSFSLRDNANATDNLLIPDNGTAAFRNGISTGQSITAAIGPINITSGTGFQFAATTVVGSRKTGWTAQTTALTRADMGAAPTLATTYTTLAALIVDLTAHGLIGP